VSNNLHTDSALDHIEDLGRATRETKDSSRAISRTAHSRLEAAELELQNGLADGEQQAAAAVSEADEFLQKEQAAAQARYAKRKSRIRAARKSSRQLALDRVESKEWKKKYSIEKEMSEIDVSFPDKLSAVSADRNEINAELTTLHAQVVSLDRDIHRGFRGYAGLAEKPIPGNLEPPAGNPPELIRKATGSIKETYSELDRARGHILTTVFRLLPIALLIPTILLIYLAILPVYFYIEEQTVPYRMLGSSMLGSLVFVLALYFHGKRALKPIANGVVERFHSIQHFYNTAIARNHAQHEQESSRLEEQRDDSMRAAKERWSNTSDRAASDRQTVLTLMDEKEARVVDTNETFHQAALTRLEANHATTIRRIQDAGAQAAEQLALDCSAAREAYQVESQAQLQHLETEWNNTTEKLFQYVDALNSTADQLFPDWTEPRWKDWAPLEGFPSAVKFGHLDVDVESLSGLAIQDLPFPLPGDSRFSVPLSLTFPQQGSLLLSTRSNAHDNHAVDTLNDIIYRLLSTVAPNKLSFTIIDPVELGQNFAGLMHLVDYEESLLNGRIWTQPQQIEERLAHLNEHMEKVIQMYLRNEYATIAEYNAKAGDIAEKYHFLVVADFPTNFSELAIRRLLSIAASGARCGVFTLIHWDRRQSIPHDCTSEDLQKNSLCLTRKGSSYAIMDRATPGITLRLDPPPDPEFATQLLQEIGQRSAVAGQVEVPFEQIAPDPEHYWTHSTSKELRVAVGRTGATKLQYFALGKGTRQHALVAGKTGSGKSTLFHIMITNLALCCSPDEVEFYLVDFKKGVEFKCYASRQLPHARVIAIESDREFGLSVLQRVDAELKHRGDLFRKVGAQDLEAYQTSEGSRTLPRTLLIIDEFQEFFTEDDPISQSAALLLDRIVRQGRAFGIHLVLGSQTLGGAYSLPSTTMGQMVVRIALQCNEADAYLIMDDDNPAPRLLSRPGEAIYNDASGRIEGNSPFQVVWLPDSARDRYLEEVKQHAEQTQESVPVPLVFEGNAPAHVEDNTVLRDLLAQATPDLPPSPRIWLGAPNSIKGPTEVTFRRQSGNNLLFVGQRDEATRASLAIALVSLAAQYPREAAKFIFFDASAPETPERQFFDKTVQAIPHDISVARNSDAPDIMRTLAQELKTRSEVEHGATAPDIYVVVYGIQKHRNLRYEEDFSFTMSDEEPQESCGATFNTVICEGPSVGIRVIATCDSYNNVNRYLSRKALSEFELRVLFQMSAGDSASLMDSPRAGDLGLYRALFYNEQEGYAETFRPYALPREAWIHDAGKAIGERIS
jgi:hypothetical protein